jgi:hypothetical protein
MVFIRHLFEDLAQQVFPTLLHVASHAFAQFFGQLVYIAAEKTPIYLPQYCCILPGSAKSSASSTLVMRGRVPKYRHWNTAVYALE